MSEPTLADLIPLWRVVEEQGVTALITPALDYVGALELGGVDVRFASDDGVAATGEALRNFVGSLDDGTVLQFLHRVEVGPSPDVDDYVAATRRAEPAALAAYVAARAAWLREQPARRGRTFLFFSRVSPTGGSALARGHLGLPMLFRNPGEAVAAEHARRLETLGAMRDRLVARLAQAGLAARALGEAEVLALYDALVNPHSARPAAAARAPLVEPLFSPKAVSRSGDHLRALTQAEQLCVDDLVEARTHLEHGGRFRRALSLKILPETGTEPFLARTLQALSEQDGSDGAPFPLWLSVTVRIEQQALARWRLNTQHKLVDALRGVFPVLAGPSVAKDVEDGAKQASIRSLFVELSQMATKVATVSVGVVLEAESLDALERRTIAVEDAFAAAGNSMAYREEASQLPAFLALLPGAGAYPLRPKGCTSRNAADFLPVQAPWCGGQVHSLFSTPSGELFRFALFDASFGVNAHHGVVCADTGSGKSFAVGLFVLDALAAGLDATLVDNGQSWKRLTELLGGVHVPVDLETSICPFLPYEHLVLEDGTLDPEALRQAVRFIEICVTDAELPEFALVHQDVLGRTIAACYRARFATRPSERPLLGDFRDFLGNLRDDAYAHPKDREVAGELHLRLRMFCEDDGLYAKMLNRPSQLRFDARLLTFDLEKVSRDPLTRRIAMAAVMEAVGARAAARKKKTLVAVDEAHEYLGQDAASEQFLSGCYAKYRKYGVAMWSITQKFETFASCRVGPVILGNSALKLFLPHGSGHTFIADYLNLSPRTQAAFAALERRPGRFSDALLLYGPRTATLRLNPHPLAYWILTTDPEDLRLLARAQARNPKLPALEVLRAVSERFPDGAHAPRAEEGRAA